MKPIVLLLAILFLGNLSCRSMTLNELRINYIKAVRDKHLCQEMIKKLQYSKSEPLYLGYLGGFQTIWAKHLMNPFSKLKTFKLGRQNIENAIKRDTMNAELRYIRLSIQKSAPSFLGFNDQIKRDMVFLHLHRYTIESEIIDNYIEKLLKE